MTGATPAVFPHAGRCGTDSRDCGCGAGPGSSFEGRLRAVQEQTAAVRSGRLPRRSPAQILYGLVSKEVADARARRFPALHAAAWASLPQLAQDSVTLGILTREEADEVASGGDGGTIVLCLLAGIVADGLRAHSDAEVLGGEAGFGGEISAYNDVGSHTNHFKFCDDIREDLYNHLQAAAVAESTGLACELWHGVDERCDEFFATAADETAKAQDAMWEFTRLCAMETAEAVGSWF